MAASFVVGYSTLPKSHETPIAAAPHVIPANQTVLIQYTLYNNKSSFTNGVIQFYFTDDNLVIFNVTNSVVQNVMFLYSNGTQIKGWVPDGLNGVPASNQGNGKWMVFLDIYSFPAPSKMTIYMKVSPSTTSELNANMSTTTSQYVGYIQPNLSDKSVTWIHSAVNKYTVSSTEITALATGTTPIVSSVNFSVNTSFVDKNVFWTIGNVYLGGSEYESGVNGFSVFGNWSIGYGSGEAFVESVPEWDPTYFIPSGRSTSSSTSYPVAASYSFSFNGTYKGGYFNFTSYNGQQSVSFPGVFGGLVISEISENNITFNNFFAINASHPIGIKLIGTTTSITPTSTGNYILFNELGLPFGQTWNITLNNKTANVINSLYTTTTEQIKAFLPTGYNYSFLFQTFDSNYYKIINESGHVILPSTSNATVNITLINKTYEAIFTESGLSSGTSWSIKVNNTTTSLTQSSTTTTNKFLLRNGTYDFTVISLVVYTANVTSGSFTINGGNINKYIGYTYTAFNETFHEQGLPKGAVWQLVINGTTYTNNSLGVIYFFGKIGTYTVKALNSSQFTPVNIYNNITITGNNNYTIDYAIYLTFIESGFTGKWSITVDGVLYTSTTNTIVAKVAPGYVSFNVSGKSGYIINPIIETTNISGPTTIDITFSTAPTNYIAALGSIYILFIVVLLGIIFMAYLFVRWRKR